MSILVLGGSKGIGLEIAKAFAGKDEQVFINYRGDDNAANRAADDIKALGGVCTLIKMDASTPEGCADIIRQVEGQTDRLNQIVHCAVDPYATTVLDADPAKFADAVSLNGLSLLYIVQAAQNLLAQGSTVFFLTSRGGRMVVDNYASIGVSKALAESLVRYLAVELASKGIRINCIAPGIVQTGAVETVFGENAGNLVAESDRKNPSGRGVRAADYTSMMKYLASPEAEYITGQTIFINGGANLHA